MSDLPRIPTLSITKRPDLDREALTVRDLVIELGGVEIQSGLQRLDLSIDAHEVNTVVLALGVDLVEVDLEALATVKAHVHVGPDEIPEDPPEAEVIPIDRGPDPLDDPA